MRFKRHSRKFSDVNKEWIKSIPKTISSTGCWIPINLHKNADGYIVLSIESKLYLLHRLAMSVFYNINYFDNSIETRHGYGCEKACFYWQHLTPGTIAENNKDKIKDRNEACPVCGGQYTNYVIKSWFRKGNTVRRCLRCKNRSRQERYKRKQNENK